MVEATPNQLFQSIWHQDIGQLKSILSDNPELVNVTRVGQWKEQVSTPLIDACSQGSYEAVKILLDYGADVSATGPYDADNWPLINLPSPRGGFGSLDGVFPLFVAVSWKKSKVTDLLLSVGADVNQKTAIGQTALHVLCQTCWFSYVRREFSLDDENDEDAANSEAELMETLIEHGADVNTCDDDGKTPLHYAAKNGLRYFVKILLRKAANVYLKDKVGLTALDYAATKDYPLTMALIDKYNFPIKQIIEAYEIVALRAPSPLQLFRKAAVLRKEHGIPKTVLPPVECYGFEKEWETIEELEKCEENETISLLQCILAGERVSTEKDYDVAYSDTVTLIWDDVWNDMDQYEKQFPKHHFNALLRHRLDRFSYFKNYLYFEDLLEMSNLSLEKALDPKYRHCISTDVLVKFVQVAIDSCCMIQTKLSSETKPVCVKELLSAIIDILPVIGGIILHLMKRSDTGRDQKHDEVHGKEFNVKYRIAQVMFDELLNRCPNVSAPLFNYVSPVIHLIFNIKYTTENHLTSNCLMYDIHMTRMIIQSQLDINAADSEGNTILHIVMSDFIQKVLFATRMFSIYRKVKNFIDIPAEMIKILLESGSYPHAKNKEGKCPGDELPEKALVLRRYNFEHLLDPVKNLLAKYDCSFTLKYQAATMIVESRIPYRDLLPVRLVQFVDLH